MISPKVWRHRWVLAPVSPATPPSPSAAWHGTSRLPGAPLPARPLRSSWCWRWRPWRTPGGALGASTGRGSWMDSRIPRRGGGVLFFVGRGWMHFPHNEESRWRGNEMRLQHAIPSKIEHELNHGREDHGHSGFQRIPLMDQPRHDSSLHHHRGQSPRT